MIKVCLSLFGTVLPTIPKHVSDKLTSIILQPHAMRAYRKQIYAGSVCFFIMQVRRKGSEKLTYATQTVDHTQDDCT